MRNNSLLIFLSALLIVLLPSCKKGEKTCQIGKHYFSDGNTTPNPDVFSYYEDGRLKKIGYANGTKDTVRYNGDTIVVLSFDRYDSLTTVFTGLLNANGAVSTATRNSYDNSGNVILSEGLSFEYNAEGRLTKQITTQNGANAVLALNYDAGNSTTGSLHLGSLIIKKYTFWHSTTENKTGVDDLNGVFMPWAGKPSANLLDSVRIIVPASADTIRVLYHHTLDANGYVSKSSESTFAPTVNTKYRTYQYFNCQD
jgi:antitoxin component YwqK of YwqJK toxin-antitoxin module